MIVCLFVVYVLFLPSPSSGSSAISATTFFGVPLDEERDAPAIFMFVCFQFIHVYLISLFSN